MVVLPLGFYSCEPVVEEADKAALVEKFQKQKEF